MKTITVKKELFKFDEICEKIKEAAYHTAECEGQIHSAILDFIDKGTLFSTSMYDDCSYEVVKEALYNGEVGVVLSFAIIDEDEENIGCADNKVYKILPDEYDINDEQKYKDALDMGSMDITSYDSVAVIYLVCENENMNISTAWYGGASCTHPARVRLEEDWGGFDKVCKDFIDMFIID